MKDTLAAGVTSIKSRSKGRIRLAFHQDMESYQQAITKGIKLCPKYRNLNITLNARTKSILIQSDIAGLEDDFIKTLESFGLISIKTNHIINRPSKNALNYIKGVYTKIDNILLNSTEGKIDLPIISAFTLCILGATQTSRQKFLPAGMPLFINALHILENDRVKKS